MSDSDDRHHLSISWSGDGGSLLSDILAHARVSPPDAAQLSEPIPPSPQEPAKPREPTRKEWEEAGWRPTVPGAPPPTLAFINQMNALKNGEAAEAPAGLPPTDKNLAEHRERMSRIKARDGGIIPLALDLGEWSTVRIDGRVMDPLLKIQISVHVKDKDRMAAHLHALAEQISNTN